MVAGEGNSVAAVAAIAATVVVVGEGEATPDATAVGSLLEDQARARVEAKLAGAGDTEGESVDKAAMGEEQEDIAAEEAGM